MSDALTTFSRQSPDSSLPTSILAVTTVALALILPSVHVWLHGAESLVALQVGRLGERGQIPEDFLHVVRQAAENRLEAQGLIDAILVAGTLALLVLIGIATARFISSTLSNESILRSASMAILIEMAVLAAIYLLVTLVRGSGGVRLSWTTQIPTDAGRFVLSGTMTWAILRGLSVGFAVRGVAFAWMLRRYNDQVAMTQALLISASASAVVLTARALLELSLM